MVMYGLISQVRTCGIGWYFVKDDKYHLYTPHEVEEILSSVGRSPSPSGEAQDGDASHHAEPIRGFVEEGSWGKNPLSIYWSSYVKNYVHLLLLFFFVVIRVKTFNCRVIDEK